MANASDSDPNEETDQFNVEFSETRADDRNQGFQILQHRNQGETLPETFLRFRNVEQIEQPDTQQVQERNVQHNIPLRESPEISIDRDAAHGQNSRASLETFESIEERLRTRSLFQNRIFLNVDDEADDQSVPDVQDMRFYAQSASNEGVARLGWRSLEEYIAEMNMIAGSSNSVIYKDHFQYNEPKEKLNINKEQQEYLERPIKFCDSLSNACYICSCILLLCFVIMLFLMMATS